MRKRFKNHFIPHEGNDYKPHFVRERNVIGVAILAIAIFGFAFSIKSLVTRNPDLLSAVITAVLVDLTNSNRLSQNIDPLTYSPTLAAAAQLKANDMASKGYFAHTSPEGKTPWYWFKEGNYQFLYAGENLAVNFVDSEDVVVAWMKSEGHRANILNGRFTEIGIAIAPGKYNGRESIYVVQLFGRPTPQETLQKLVVIDESVSTSTTEEETSISGATAENVEILIEDEMFVAVQNSDYADIDSTLPNRELVAQASLVDKALASPKMLLKIVYMLIGGVVFLALILFLYGKPRRQHTKNVIYLIFLLVLITTLLYISSVYLFPQILIK